MKSLTRFLRNAFAEMRGSATDPLLPGESLTQRTTTNSNFEGGVIKRIAFLLVAVAAVAAVIAAPARVSGHTDEAASPIYGVTIPPGYRDWKMIAVAQLETDKVDQLRAQLGNEIAFKAYKEGTRPFPDGSIIVALHWNRVPSEDNDRVLAGSFPGAQSFVVGSPVNMQIMVKDSKKYAATGGWGFGDFKDGKPGDEALHKTCFACHEPAKDWDFVFTHYAP
jgi:hypothetical protein